MAYMIRFNITPDEAITGQDREYSISQISNKQRYSSQISNKKSYWSKMELMNNKLKNSLFVQIGSSKQQCVKYEVVNYSIIKNDHKSWQKRKQMQHYIDKIMSI